MRPPRLLRRPLGLGVAVLGLVISFVAGSAAATGRPAAAEQSRLARSDASAADRPSPVRRRAVRRDVPRAARPVLAPRAARRSRPTPRRPRRCERCPRCPRYVVHCSLLR